MINDAIDFILQHIDAILGFMAPLAIFFTGKGRSYDLLKSPMPIKGLDCFENRLKTKHVNNTMLYITLIIMFWVIGAIGTFLPDNWFVEISILVIVIFSSIWIAISFFQREILYLKNIKSTNIGYKENDKKIRERIFWGITLLLITMVLIACYKGGLRKESVNIYKIVIFVGVISLFEASFAYIFITSYNTEEYEALLYYLDGDKKVYIYYRYDDEYFICGLEPNINSAKYYFFKEWSELRREKVYTVNRKYTDLNRKLEEAYKLIDDNNNEHNNQLEKLSGYKEKIGQEKLSKSEMREFEKLYNDIMMK